MNIGITPKSIELHRLPNNRDDRMTYDLTIRLAVTAPDGSELQLSVLVEESPDVDQGIEEAKFRLGLWAQAIAQQAPRTSPGKRSHR